MWVVLYRSREYTGDKWERINGVRTWDSKEEALAWCIETGRLGPKRVEHYAKMDYRIETLLTWEFPEPAPVDPEWGEYGL